MKKQQIITLILILFLVSIVIFFAFFSENKNKKAFNDNSLKVGQTIINSGSSKQEVDMKLLEEQKKQKLLELAQKKAEEVKLVNEVGISGDTSQCSSISDTLRKQECFDNGNLAKATLENTVRYCLLVKNENYKNNCTDNFFYNDAISKNDGSICSKIKNESLKNNCNSSIIFTKVESESFTGTVSVCSNLIGKEKEYCEGRIKKADDIEKLESIVEKGSKNANCSDIKDNGLKNLCNDTQNLEIAISNKDVNYCNKILDISKKEGCITEVNKDNDNLILQKAILGLSIDDCNKISSKILVQDCKDNIYFKKAISENNKDFCSNISKTEIKTECSLFFSQKN